MGPQLPAWPVLPIFIIFCSGVLGRIINDTALRNANELQSPLASQNLKLKDGRPAAVSTAISFTGDPEAIGEACPTYEIGSSGIDNLQLRKQLESCLNDMRQRPNSYRPSFPCDYDMVIAAKLTSGGDRLPLRTTDHAALQYLSMAAQEDAAQLAALGALTNVSLSPHALSDWLAPLGFSGLAVVKVTDGISFRGNSPFCLPSM
eukprot:jgi/Botrbrau1/10106/Bobra.20_2s0013.1